MNCIVGPDFQTRQLGRFEALEYFSKVHEHLNLNKEQIRKIAGHINDKGVANIHYLLNKTKHPSDLEVEQRKLYSLKRSVFQLLTAPLRTFLSNYLMKIDFLDGYRGFLIACLASIYKFVMISKQIEKNRQE